MSPFNMLFKEIKERKIRKWLAIYASSSITIIGLINLFSLRYNFSPKVFDIVLIILLCGIPSVLVFAWFHSKQGVQKIGRNEILIHSFILVVALILVIRSIISTSVKFIPIEEKSIAVLPFKNLSDFKDDEYFSDGVTEDILTQLSKINDLKVISRTSVMKYKNTPKTIREIGEELGVSVILEGSVRRAGNRVRIVGQLINARTDEHIWVETYDREMSDIFAIQTEVAISISTALEAKLSSKELRQIENRGTASIDAYSYYLRGRDYYYNYTKQDNDRAIELFKKALEIDPDYALAYAGLADAYVWKKIYEYSPQWLDSALILSKKAISIDPNLPEGYKALGSVYSEKELYSQSLEQYIKAIDLNPNYAAAITNIGFTYYTLGKLDNALIWMKKAMVIEPGSARWNSNVGLQYFYLLQDSVASIWFEKAIKLQPEFFFPNIILAYIDLYDGKYEAARNRINRILEANPDINIILESAGDIEIIAGRHKEAKQFYEKAVNLSSFRSGPGVKLAFVLLKRKEDADAKKILEMNITSDTEDISQYKEGTSAYYTAASYCLVQNYEQSIKFLKLAVELGFCDYRWILIDPLFTNLRNNKEFASILTDLKSRIDEMRNRVKEENL